MNTHGSLGTADWCRRQKAWTEALASGDPAQRWSAACSIARKVAFDDVWVDSTALYEAACEAYDAATDGAGGCLVAMATLGARRALYWERQERLRLVPSRDLGLHRWRADADRHDHCTSGLIPLDAAADWPAESAVPSVGAWPAVAEWAGRQLVDAKWPWAVPADDAVAAAVDAVVEAGRDRAGAAVAERYPALPAVVANGLALLVAGSRRRDGMAWPGIVWLHAHFGPDAAAADPGTRAVVAGIVTGHKSRPVTDVARQREADARHHRPDARRAYAPAPLRASRRADSSSRQDADRQVLRAS
jgi:hypothetical protein